MKKSMVYGIVCFVLLMMSVGPLLAFQPPPPPRRGGDTPTPTPNAALQQTDNGNSGGPPPPPRRGDATPEATAVPAADDTSGPPPPRRGDATPEATAVPAADDTSGPPPPPRRDDATPEAAAPTVEDADIRLVYSAEGVTLINLTDKPVWLAGLLFRGESGEFPAERWTESSPVNIEEFEAGGCLQIRVGVSLDAPEECKDVKGWVSSQNPRLQFWMGDFEVTSYYNKVTDCSAEAGVCEFKLPSI